MFCLAFLSGLVRYRLIFCCFLGNLIFLKQFVKQTHSVGNKARMCIGFHAESQYLKCRGCQGAKGERKGLGKAWLGGKTAGEGKGEICPGSKSPGISPFPFLKVVPSNSPTKLTSSIIIIRSRLIINTCQHITLSVKIYRRFALSKTYCPPQKLSAAGSLLSILIGFHITRKP